MFGQFATFLSPPWFPSRFFLSKLLWSTTSRMGICCSTSFFIVFETGASHFYRRKSSDSYLEKQNKNDEWLKIRRHILKTNPFIDWISLFILPNFCRFLCFFLFKTTTPLSVVINENPSGGLGTGPFSLEPHIMPSLKIVSLMQPSPSASENYLDQLTLASAF